MVERRALIGLKGTAGFETFCCNFVHPILPVSFGRDIIKGVGPFYLVSMTAEVKDPSQGNGKYLFWTQCAS